MSAAVRVPILWGAAAVDAAWDQLELTHQEETIAEQPTALPSASAPEPFVSLAFYRKHTESLLRRYLYASMQVGRAPSVLGDTVGRGWVSSHPVRTFEDAVIFVLDIETCLGKLTALERQVLSRIVLQDYTYTETAKIMGVALRTVCYKYPRAVDRLTELLLQAGLLMIPK